MITKECERERICLFCASEYHLEMILLPYIKEHIDTDKIIIFTENDLTESLNFVLRRTNLKTALKNKIKKIDWRNNNDIKINKLEKYIKENNKLKIIINGNNKFIKQINNEIGKYKYENIIFVDCFHIEDLGNNIEKIGDRYKYILNTSKL